jgi:hypothetical protein
VIIAALRSRRGASFAILQRIGIQWEPMISVPLILEYEAVGNEIFAPVDRPGIRVATDREYIETRAKLFREEFERALKANPDVEPEPYDRQ